MSLTERRVTPFITTQFPGHYRDDAPDFVTFLKTYYEYLETENRFVFSFRPSSWGGFETGGTIISGFNPTNEFIVIGVGDDSIDVIGEGGLAVTNVHAVLSSTEATGLINIANNSNIVTGQGTSFSNAISVGSYINVNDYLYWVESVANDTYATITETYVGDDINLRPWSAYELSERVDLLAADQRPSTVAFIRGLLDYNDIDKTLNWLVQSFKNKYMLSMPDRTQVTQRFLVKHILDLYRVKGTPRAHRLLFRILFNEDIEFFLPPKHLFSASEAKWVVTQYVECVPHELVNEVIGRTIFSSSGGARGVVDSVITKTRNGRLVSVLTISSVEGIFHRDEFVLCDDIPEFEARIVGSLSAVGLTGGGLNYTVGDILDVHGVGAGAKAVVAATRDESGRVSFQLLDGGSGYSMDADILVEGGGGTGATFRIGGLTNREIFHINTDVIEDYLGVRLERAANSIGLTLTGISGTFDVGEYVTANTPVVPLDVTEISGTLDVGEKAIGPTGNGVVCYSDGSFVRLIGTAGTIAVGDTLTGNISGAQAEVNIVFDTDVVEANALVVSWSSPDLHVSNVFTFSTNCFVVFDTSVTAAGSGYANDDVVTIDKDDVSGRDASALILTNNTGNVVAAVIRDQGSRMNAAPTFSISGSGTGANLSFTTGQLAGWFVIGGQVTGGNSGALGTVSALDHHTDWSFPRISFPDEENLGTPIEDALIIEDLEVGTIRFIAGINPGSGYTSNPTVSVTEPDVVALEINDGNGGIKGNNASVSANAVFGRVVSAVRILDSGFAYEPGEPLSMTNANNVTVVTGDAVIDMHGHDGGTWKNDRSFASSTMHLQDSHYWQRFSYDIFAPRMLSTYERFVKDLVHPSGMALFGTFRHSDVVGNSSALVTGNDVGDPLVSPFLADDRVISNIHNHLDGATTSGTIDNDATATLSKTLATLTLSANVHVVP